MKNRRDFIRLSGLAGMATLLPLSRLFAGNCTLIPDETEGPYPYPGGELGNPLQMVDIRVGQTGVQLDLTFTIVDAITCVPLQNVRVDIWHCSKDGDYSGYGSFVGQTFLRGFQLTDVNGEAHFTTVYPGWYPGRATHIHVELFYNNVMIKTTQVAFDETINDVVHTSALYSGVNPTLNLSDGIFANSPGDLTKELVAVSGNTTTGYTGTITMGVNGITGIAGPDNPLDNIRIYPDRDRNELIITYPGSENNTIVKVLTAEGKQVSSGVLKPGTMTTRMDVSRLSAGIYFLIAESRSNHRTMKFIKN